RLHVIGHVASTNDSDGVALCKKIQSEYPDVIVKNLDEFIVAKCPADVTGSSDMMQTLLNGMRKFALDNLDVAILFVGSNRDSRTFIDIPGRRYYIDIATGQLMH